MAAKRTSSNKRANAKKAVANIEKAHKNAELNLKKLKAALGNSFHSIVGGHSFGK